MKNKHQSDKHVVRENVFGANNLYITLFRQTCSARKCVWGE